MGREALADKLRNICFVQRIFSDRIQTIVRSRSSTTFDEIAETALEGESAIFSKNEKHKGPTRVVSVSLSVLNTKYSPQHPILKNPHYVSPSIRATKFKTHASQQAFSQMSNLISGAILKPINAYIVVGVIVLVKYVVSHSGNRAV